MPADSTPLARNLPPAQPTEAEYDSFCAALMETARGRWFLAEYARRHRKSATDTALAALQRIEESLRQDAPGQQAEHLREELLSLLATIRGAKFDIGWADSEFAKGAKVMALLDLLEQRIVDLTATEGAPIAAPSHAGRRATTDIAPPPDEKPDTTRVQLTVITAGSAPAPVRMRIEPPQVDILSEPARPQAPARRFLTDTPEPGPTAPVRDTAAIGEPVNMIAAPESAVAESAMAEVAAIGATSIETATLIETTTIETTTVVASDFSAPEAAGPQAPEAAPPLAATVEQRPVPPAMPITTQVMAPAVQTTTGADPMAQVMALSPEERIALMS